MEDLLRKCSGMSTPIPECREVQTKYCSIWPRELYCLNGGGGGSVRIPTISLCFLIIHCVWKLKGTPAPSNNDPDWLQVHWSYLWSSLSNFFILVDSTQFEWTSITWRILCYSSIRSEMSKFKKCNCSSLWSMFEITQNRSWLPKFQSFSLFCIPEIFSVSQRRHWSQSTSKKFSVHLLTFFRFSDRRVDLNNYFIIDER